MIDIIAKNVFDAYLKAHGGLPWKDDESGLEGVTPIPQTCLGDVDDKTVGLQDDETDDRPSRLPIVLFEQGISKPTDAPRGKTFPLVAFYDTVLEITAFSDLRSEADSVAKTVAMILENEFQNMTLVENESRVHSFYRGPTVVDRANSLSGTVLWYRTYIINVVNSLQ